MPISRYPRPGHPIAPSVLKDFLDGKAPFGAGRFCELDSSAWDRFDPGTCHRLGRAVVSELYRQQSELVLGLPAKKVPTLTKQVTVEDLELEVRTRNCLRRIGIQTLPDDLEGQSLGDLMAIRAFGVKCLVDFLTSIEPLIDSANMAAVQVHKPNPLVPRNMRQIVRSKGSLPAYLYNCVFPTPPDNVPLCALDLRTRTLHVLAKCSFSENPKKLGMLTVGQALQLPGFGIESVVDLAEKLHRYSDSGDVQGEVTYREGMPPVPPHIRKIVQKERGLPHRLLQHRLPMPRPDMSLSTLGLKRRTFNALKKAGYSENVQALGALTAHDALQIRGFGITCLVDLVEAIYRSGVHDRQALVGGTDQASSGHGQNFVPRALRRVVTREGRIPRRLLASVLPRLPDWCTLHDLQLDLRVFNALEHAGYAQSLERLGGLPLSKLLDVQHLGPKGICDLVEAIYRCRDQSASGRPLQTLDQLVLDCLVPSRNTRDRQIVAKYFGLCGEPIATLEEIGGVFRITRERVRQVVSRRTGNLKKLRSASVVKAVLAAVQEGVPCAATDLEKSLVAQRLIEKKTRAAGVIRTLDAISCDLKYLVIGPPEHQVIIAADDAEVARRIESAAKAHLRKLGCSSIQSIVDQLSSKAEVSYEFVEAVIQSLPGFRWLEREIGWFWLQMQCRNPLRKQIRKVLSVAHVIGIAELRGALRRDYRRYAIPPVRILREFCRQIPECHVYGDQIVADQFEQAEDVLRGDELILVRLLLRHGPVCKRKQLQRLARAAGVSAPSFWRCVNYCPTISRFAEGVYGLTGAEVPADLVESLRTKKQPGRLVVDHGWTDDGQVWLACRVSDAFAETGVMAVPSAKRSYIRGEYSLQTPENASVGKLVVKDCSAWGLGPFLRRAGAEPGDILLIKFALASKTATVRLGDEGLLEEVTGAD